MKHYSQIKHLQTLGKKLTIIECGSAACISNSILSVPGSSALIEATLQPYSKESQIACIGEFKRSVSFEHVNKFINYVDGDVLVVSCQIQGCDEKILTHGWVGMRSGDIEKYYHFSIPDKPKGAGCDEMKKRAFYLDAIVDIAVGIISYQYADRSLEITEHVHEKHLFNKYIDGVFNKDESVDFDTTINVIAHSKTVPVAAVFTHHSWQRLEDFMRNATGVVLMRGSFNPVHVGHLSLLENAMKHYSAYKGAFQVSLQRYDKPNVTPEEAREKLNSLSNLNYPVVFTGGPLYDDTMTLINKRWDVPIVFPMGTDTIQRVIDTDVQSARSFSSAFSTFYSRFKDYVESNILPVRKNLKFLVSKREGYTLNESLAKVYGDMIVYDNDYVDSGISSTKIRNNECGTGL